MSNLSDIGFPVASDEEVNQVLMDVLPHLVQHSCPPHGFYYQFSDGSGAELYLQANPAQDLVGFNPAFAAEEPVNLTIHRKIERDTSELDGGFVAEGAGGTVFVFDSPDFRLRADQAVENTTAAVLTAFASNDLATAPAGTQIQAGSLRPLRDTRETLFAESGDGVPPQAHVFIEAPVISAELRTNGLTGETFYAMKARTNIGDVSIVADPALLVKTPEPGTVIKGSFWLSGKVVQP